VVCASVFWYLVARDLTDRDGEMERGEGVHIDHRGIRQPVLRKARTGASLARCVCMPSVTRIRLPRYIRIVFDFLMGGGGRY
jgi:hypothetical protein